MLPTLFGLVIFVIGAVLLLRARPPAMFALVLVCALMSGSATVILTALGNSSIPPAHFALIFLVLRLFLPGSGQRPLLAEAMRANALLVAYVLYGVVMAFVGPRLFAGDINIVPLRLTEHYIYATVPLMPTAQNITTSVYLIGTLLAAIGAYVIARNPGGPALIVRTGVIVAWVHIALGVSGVLLKGTTLDAVFDFFRNGAYAQLDQNIGGLVRMNGIMPEPSVYATFGVGWFVFLFECWYRDVMPRWTGPVALAMGTTLLATTSSTAYVALGGYGAVLLVRTLLIPIGLDSSKLIKLVFALLAMTILLSAVFILKPGLASSFGNVIVAMTVGKQDSLSGLQRAFWAKQGLNAFVGSWGLGVGPGSFRSSSISTAIAGSTGIFGALAFCAYLLHVLKPLRTSTYTGGNDRDARIGVAATWAAVGLLLPASVIGTSCDPGTDFAMLAGLSLALRRGLARGAVSTRRDNKSMATEIRTSMQPVPAR